MGGAAEDEVDTPRDRALDQDPIQQVGQAKVPASLLVSIPETGTVGCVFGVDVQALDRTGQDGDVRSRG